MIDLKQYNYTGITPKPKFNTEFYLGQDVYSDGNIEDDIIKIISQNPSTDYEKAINDNFSWPVFYHLTRIRQNLLNWYPFGDNSNVLEIGCGMGAITELLCQKCKSVTSVELSQKRATATYLRCRDYDNLEIIVGNLNDIEFEKKYDYITLIGVLEYQNNFTQSQQPFRDFISKIKSLLAPNGKLIIAIENKYGLKYWCGAPEDHSGIPFDSINDYKYSNVARTFSKQELDTLIKDNGFNHTYFYYPLPDYKMPQVVYSQDYLPVNGSIDNWIPYYTPNNRSMITDEEHLYKDLVDNNVFEFFANSFLVECSVDNEDIGDILYVTSNPFRNYEYNMITAYSKKDGFYKIADKQSINALNMIDASHKELSSRGLKVAKTKINNNILYIETIKGKSLTQVIVEAYKSKDENQVYAIFDKIYSEIKLSSDEADCLNNIFQESEELKLPKLDKNDKILKSAFIDMIHKNCFVDDDNNYIWIDQEWRMDNIPASYVLFYNIVQIYSANEWLNLYFSINELLKHYNLLDKCKSYMNLKNMFLSIVQNKYSASNYNKLLSKNDDNHKDNILLLLQNLSKLNNTQKSINDILQKGNINDVINYVNTLQDEVILKDIPDIPRFIVAYLGLSELQKQQLDLKVKSYQDIIKVLKSI